MKLLHKTGLYYLLFAIPVFMVCSGLLYYLVSAEIIDHLDEYLMKEKIEIEKSLKCGKIATELDNEISLQLINGNISAQTNIFSDTLIFDAKENEFEPFRVLTTTINDGKNYYKLRINESYIESDDLLFSILLPVFILFIVLLLGFYFINWYISKNLWKPFYATLQKLREYKVDSASVNFDKSGILEFSELNAELIIMTEKIHTDYLLQKQFIENASHEIQTPLAVIKAKIELLIQSNRLSEQDMLIIQSVYNAGNKLSTLNRSLLMLSKIENNQFKDVEEIQFKTFIEKSLEHFEDIISLKNIRIEKNYQATPTCKMSAALAEILITNIVQNAIRHNIKDGSITISLTENSFIISNSSSVNVSNTAELFNRFKKSEASAESVGLGLSIVKEICNTYKIRINYTCKDLVHAIEFKF